jgi:flagellar biosynthesis/type III secretory pathway protein FliH
MLKWQGRTILDLECVSGLTSTSQSELTEYVNNRHGSEAYRDGFSEGYDEAEQDARGLSEQAYQDGYQAGLKVGREARDGRVDT